jgi:hypothetical protein
VKVFRGSRLHILDWVESPRFREDLNSLVVPYGFEILPNALILPLGRNDPREARLESFMRGTFPPASVQSLREWWLGQGRGNTPNWDLAARAIAGGRDALVLIEAKASVPELSSSGKAVDSKASEASKANAAQIESALRTATDSLACTYPGTKLSCDSHYQLSNRIAFAWKIAGLGIPVLLIYLGFTGDRGIQDAGEPLSDAEHWTRVFHSHLESCAPTSLLAGRVDCGSAWFQIVTASRSVLQDSPPKIPRAAV